jgi:hypothetical protein
MQVSAELRAPDGIAPAAVASNQTVISIPGTASCFTRMSGRKSECSTSSDRRVMLTARFTGTCMMLSVEMSSAVPVTPSGPA